MPKRKYQSEGEDQNDGAIVELPGIPLAPCQCHHRSVAGVYFVLDKASLVVANVGKKYQILNADDHASFLRKKNKNPYAFRPEIVHQSPYGDIIDCVHISKQLAFYILSSRITKFRLQNTEER